MRSTQEWEKALEGTTPPQWEAKQYGHEWIVVQAPVTTDVGREGYGNLRYVADVYGAENAHLSALAPEAVAEVVRLRRELEALRDEFRFVHHRRRAHEHITRILEGES